MAGMKKTEASLRHPTPRQPRRRGTGFLLLAGGLLMCVCFLYSAFVYRDPTVGSTRDQFPSRLLLILYAVSAITSTATGMWLLGWRLRFRISTWLAVLAIIAWLMASRPIYVPEQVSIHFASANEAVEIPGWLLMMDGDPTRAYYSRLSVNWRLRWGAIPLAAFLAWKAAWLVRARSAGRTDDK